MSNRTAALHKVPVQLVLALTALAPWLALQGCGKSQRPGDGKPVLQVTSTSFPAGGNIPKKFTCDEGDTSPALAWSAAPAGTQSIAVIVTDPDAPLGSFTHWVVYDLPPDKREIPENLPKQAQLSDGSRQGQNDFDNTGYGGPCPPGSSPHHYVFTVYALDTKLNLPAPASKKDVEKALADHILARGETVGLYVRQKGN
jgi:Raf kinase inhibitor-like YbhB/YbcL family protein